MHRFNRLLTSAPSSPGCSRLCHLQLEGRLGHMISNEAGHSFLHPTCTQGGQSWGPCYFE